MMVHLHFHPTILLLSAAAVVSAQSTSSSSSSSSSPSLPTTQYARTRAASVVAGSKWLLIGGVPALARNDRNYNRALSALGSGIESFDLRSKIVSKVSTSQQTKNNTTTTTNNANANVDRAKLMGQTCEYDAGSERVYCFGGKTSDNKYAPGIGVFDPVTNTWAADVDVDVPLREGHTSVVLGDSMYIFGGLGTNSDVAWDLHRIPFRTLQSTRLFTTAFPYGRTGACAAALSPTTFLLIGGSDSTGSIIADAWIFDAEKSDWEEVTGRVRVPVGRTGLACTNVGEEVVVFGGEDGEGRSYGDIYQIRNSTLRPPQTRSLRRRQSSSSSAGAPGARVNAQIASLNGYVAIAGGSGSGSNGALHFFDAQSSSAEWVPSVDALTRALVPGEQIAAEPSSTRAAVSTTRPPAVVATTAPVRSAKTSTTEQEVGTPAATTAAVTRSASTSTQRVIPTAPVGAGEAPGFSATASPSTTIPVLVVPTSTLEPTSTIIPVLVAPSTTSETIPSSTIVPVLVVPSTTAAPTGSSTISSVLAVPTTSEVTPSSTFIPSNTRPFPTPAENAGESPIPAPVIIPAPVVIPPAIITTATPSPTRNTDPLCGDACKDNALLAFLLVIPLGLCALMGLCAACVAARKVHKKDKRSGYTAARTYYDNPAPVVNRTAGFEHVGLHAAPTTTPQPQMTSTPATTAAGAPHIAPLTTRSTAAPGTPKRSDSRRRVHSPMSQNMTPAAAATTSAPLTDPHSHSHSHVKRYKVLWASAPAQLDEVDAAAGDIVEEKRIFADGWALVHNVTRGATGMIPVNILEEIKPESTTTTSTAVKPNSAPAATGSN
ncbi:hypothetical protein DFJ77DRAFT_251114 [Powellomyces hirtus]|nr:hypothetical protein DFJ77DRAFT_251114 [Powellomyces hirtus]